VAASYVGLLLVAPAGGLAAAYALATATSWRPSLAATCALGGVFVAVVGGQAVALRRAAPPEARQAEAAPRTRHWLRVALPLLVVSGFTVLLDRADLLMVGALEGVADAGRYNAATRTARLISFLLTALSAMAVPLMSEAWAAGDRARLEGVMRTVIGWIFWPSLALSVALIAFGEAVLGLFGDGFEAAYGALVLLTLGQLTNAATGPVVYLLGITGHERLTARLSVGAAGFNLAANAALIHALGFTGAAWATALTMAAWNMGAAYWVRRRVGVSVFRAWAQMLRLAPPPSDADA
jgi:O-antigen/teichoic acid export membrane protein